METDHEKFYLVHRDVLPEAMKKTIEAKELLKDGTVETIYEAAKKVNLSRSAFYKYKDTVFPFETFGKEQIITLFFYIEDRTGTLFQLLQTVAQAGCNVLTIHQTIPIQGKANVALSLDISKMNIKIGELIHQLKSLSFVERVDMLSSEF